LIIESRNRKSKIENRKKQILIVKLYDQELARQHRADVGEMAQIRRDMDAQHAKERAELMAHLQRMQQEAERIRQREAEVQAQVGKREEIEREREKNNMVNTNLIYFYLKLAREREQAAAKMKEVMEQQARIVVQQPQQGGGRRPGFWEKAFGGVGKFITNLVPKCSVM
jgi:hypothetical protein